LDLPFTTLPPLDRLKRRGHVELVDRVIILLLDILVYTTTYSLTTRIILMLSIALAKGGKMPYKLLKVLGGTLTYLLLDRNPKRRYTGVVVAMER
jgi:hypothetical protein